MKALSCVLYYCYYHKVSFAIKRVLFAENLKKMPPSSVLGKIYLILLKYPKKGQYRRICRSIFVDENLVEQLAEIGRSADCALRPCQLEMEDCCTVHCTYAGHVEGISCQKKHKSGKGIRISSEYCSATKLHREEEEVKARYEEEPMRGSITNKQTAEVPLAADWHI